MSADPRDIAKSFANLCFTAAALTLNFILTPVVARLLKILFFPNSPSWQGLIMLLVTPCIDWYSVFIGMSRRNVELGMSVLPLNLVLQVLLFSVYLMIFMGSRMEFDTVSMLAVS